MFLRNSLQRFQSAVIILLLCVPPSFAGFTVSGSQLIDANGYPFIMRGINHSHTWHENRLSESLLGIAGYHANTVRIVLSNGFRWGKNSAEQILEVIEQAKARKLIVVLEVHDTTGYGEDPMAAPLNTAVDYWIEMSSVLVGQEDFVIINIGNEPFGNFSDSSSWIEEHQVAITRLREAGLTHTLMVDAPNWGQDWNHTMKDSAPLVYGSDPLGNTVFSVHMYEVYQEQEVIQEYMEAFINNNLTLVVGEFAATHKGENVDEYSIMSLAQAIGIGYIGWSWSGNNVDTEDLDIVVNWNTNELSPWGNSLINSDSGIISTSSPASVFEEQ